MSRPLVNSIWTVWMNPPKDPGWWPKDWGGQIKRIQFDSLQEIFYVLTVDGEKLKFNSIDDINLWARTCARLER